MVPPPSDLKTLEKGTSVKDASKIIASNYGLYHEIADQLTSLQDWVKKQLDVQNGISKKTSP